GEVKISDLTQEWIRRTGLSFDSLKQYRDKFGSLIRDFVYENKAQLGNSYRFVDLLQHMFPPPKAKARPAKASSFKAAGCIPSEYCPQCGSDAEHCRCPNKEELLDGETRGDKLASEHHRRQVCKCGSVQTCRCSAAKTTFNVNSCSNCRTAAAKPKCPHCGSDDYGLMPTDFETAKCNKCGKNWEHGIVEGINDPKEAAALPPPPKPQPQHVQQAPAARKPAPPKGSPAVKFPSDMQQIYIPHVEKPKKIREKLQEQRMHEEEEQRRSQFTNVAAVQTEQDIHPPADAPYCDGCDRPKVNCICEGCTC